MEILHAQLSSAGPVRANNEDCVGFWEPAQAEEKRVRGAVAVLADGVGGQRHGEVASQLAVQTTIRRFAEAKAGQPAGQVLFEMLNAANLAVYDTGMQQRDGRAAGEGRMATTLTVCVFRNNEVSIGHVGDCRVYLLQQGRLRRLTNDHSYVGVQVKLGLVSAQEALNSPLRSVLTRSIGQDPTVRADYHTVTVSPGDVLMQCTDGLYCCITEGEIAEILSKSGPTDACQELIDRAIRRGADDNLSAQVIHVKEVERLSYYRGVPVYQKVQEPSMGTDVQVGQLLDDRFLIEDVVSRSGMASIFKATDLQTNRKVAVKVPFMQFESDPGFYSRFMREEEIARKLDHPYILHVEPVQAERSRPYIVMEYLEGQTLGHLMRSLRPLPAADALKIAGRICEALHYLHEHDVVHRDLKPDNIMVCDDGSIRIMDFGIAKAAGHRRLTFGGFQPALGTPDYMAPEQVRGKRGDARTDIYSLGAILYEMVTGSVPFEGPNPFAVMNARVTGDPVAPRQRNPQVPPEVEEIVLHAMAREPAERYPSAAAMRAELNDPQSVQLTGRAQRLVTPTQWQGRWRRSRLVLLAVLVPVLVFVLIYVLSHLQWRP